MTMARYERAVTDDRGNIVPGSEVRVQREAPGLPLEALYADRGGQTPLGNPFVIGGDGVMGFHCRGGSFRITITKGTFTRVLRYVAIGLAQESDDSLNVDPQSAWNSIDTFSRNMIVSDQGAAWIAKRENTNAPPPTLPTVENDDWLLLSAPGAGIVGSALQLDQIMTPNPPSAGRNLLYFKDDDKLYKQTSGGVETEVGAGGGGSYPPGFLFGFSTAPNGSNPTTEIDVQAGDCRDATNSVNQIMAAPYTISLAAFDESGKGSLDTGSVGNNSYFIHIISGAGKATRPLTSLSPTAPTMPSGYTHFRRIASIMRASGAIRAYRQVGDMFSHATAVEDRNTTTPIADQLVTLTVPIGIKVQPILSMVLRTGAASSTAENKLGDGDAATASVYVAGVETATNTANRIYTVLPSAWFTNTSGQIRMTAAVQAGSISNNILQTIAWIDRRGQDGGA